MIEKPSGRVVKRQHSSRIAPEWHKAFETDWKANKACQICKWRMQFGHDGKCCCGWMARHRDLPVGQRRRPCAYNPDGPCECFEAGKYQRAETDENWLNIEDKNKGKKRKMRKVCKGCGRFMKNDATVCRHCGTKWEAEK